MNVLKQLELKIKDRVLSVKFGQPNTETEKENMFKFRFKEYVRKGYIDPDFFSDGLDKDEYDLKNKCHYFVAFSDEKIIGTVRLILDDPLPTQKVFTFEEPKEVLSIKAENRGELGRLISNPLLIEDGIYFPRGIIMLMLLSVLVDFGLKNNIKGGYSFVKQSLVQKMKKRKMPMHIISSFKQDYKSDGVLFPYFNQSNDPVIPMYFLTEEFFDYVNSVFNRKWMFEIHDEKVTVKNNLFIKLLRLLRFF